MKFVSICINILSLSIKIILKIIKATYLQIAVEENSESYRRYSEPRDFAQIHIFHLFSVFIFLLIIFLAL